MQMGHQNRAALARIGFTQTSPAPFGGWRCGGGICRRPCPAVQDDNFETGKGRNCRPVSGCLDNPKGAKVVSLGHFEATGRHAFHACIAVYFSVFVHRQNSLEVRCSIQLSYGRFTVIN